VCDGTHSALQDAYPAQAVNYSETHDLQVNLLINFGSKTNRQTTTIPAPIFNTCVGLAALIIISICGCNVFYRQNGKS